MGNNGYTGELVEETVLFISVIKWVFLASLIGIVVGMSTAVFLKLIDMGASANTFGGVAGMNFLILPLAFMFSTFLVSRFSPQAAGHGTEKIIEAIHKTGGRIPASVIPVKVAATLVTLSVGGSAGKEGPSAQIGAGIASLFARLMSFEEQDQKKLVICGISAGFASVFGTPIAGAIFGVEVLYAGSLLYSALMPAFIAGMVSYHVSAGLGIQYSYHPLSFTPVFNETFFIEVIVAGIFFGICAFVLIEILRAGKHLSERLTKNVMLRAAFGGISLAFLSTVYSTKYLGLGIDTITLLLHGGGIEWYALLVKACATSVTLNFGGSGGIVTPIFFIGASAGSVYADVLGLDMATFASIGLVSLLAGATNAPIAASIMAVELFGSEIAPYAAIACIISFLMTGHRSVYPSQRLATPKSSSLQVDRDDELDEDVHVKVRRRRKTVTGKVIGVVDSFKETNGKKKS